MNFAMTSLLAEISPLRSVAVRIVAASLSIALLAGCTPAARRARALDRAERYFKAGEYDKARIEYLNLLRLDRMNRTAIKQLGIIWFEDGAPLRAFPFLKATRDLDPNNFNNRTKLASVLLMIGEAEGARKEASAILQQSPSEGEALIVLADSARSKQAIEETEQQLQQIKPPESSSLHLALANLALRKNDRSTSENELQRALIADPKSSMAHLAMANFRFLEKDLNRAGQEFKAAAELAPARSFARVKYAEFQAINGAPNDARASLKETTRQAPDYLPAWLVSAQLALNEKKYDESLSFLENIFNRDPENIDARILEAQARLAKGESKKAVQVLEALAKTFPNSPAVEYHLARAYIADNNLAQATAELKKAVAAKPGYLETVMLLAQVNMRTGNYQEVVPAMVELLKKQPDLVAAQTVLAEAYRSMGRLDEAAAVVQQQIKVSPQNPQAYFLLGVILRQQNKADEARQAFQKTLELSPDNLLPIDQLVALDLTSNDFGSAMQRVQAQLQKTPNSAALHFIEAKIYAVQREWDRAEAALSKALALEPNYPSAYELLISIYVSTNKLPQAVSELQTYLSKKPDDPRALMTLAVIYDKQKEFLKARDAYEKLLAKNPEFVPALNNLAYLYADELNDPDKAYDLARKARELQGTDASVADTLGWVLYKKKDYQQALALFQESAGKLAQDPNSQFHLGMASYMMGQTESARAAFQEALKESADFAGKEEAQRRLALLGNDSSEKLSSEQLESMLKQQPNDPLARLRLGETYEKQKAFPKAAAEYEQALKINPKLLSALISLAQLNAGPLQNSEKALEFAKKARELAPADAKVAGILGHVAYHAGNFTWAYSLLQESARQLADDPMVLHDYAWAAYSLGKVSEAQELMQRAMQAAPAPEISEDAKSFLAMTALDRNPKDAAALEPEVQKLLKADPHYVPALMARASIEVQKSDSKKAIVTYSEILQRFPDFAPAQKRLAVLYLEDPAALDKAYEFAVKARKTLPNDPELARSLGEISYQRKEYPRAVQLLQESARTNPLDAKALYYLGVSQLQIKQKPQAKEALERALAAGLQEPLASEAKRLLAEPKAK
jgi:tetratricopeptide (TPR) repeat protein